MRKTLLGATGLLLAGVGFLCVPGSAPGDVVGSKPMSLAEGARLVVAAVVQAGKENSRLPESGPVARRRLGEDDLTVLYVRAAAAAAQRLPAERAVPAFLVGLGIALDDSTILRGNPMTLKLCREVESDAERKERLAVLGKPTMRRRRDWTQHFVVSCTLTELYGAELAEAAGLLKEQLDMQPGGSGFSFGDLSADFAGVDFAVRLKKSELVLETVARSFAVADYLPEPTGLPEDLSREQFRRDFGSFDDPRFKAEVAEVRKRIRALPGRKMR